jgi:serpin B
LLEEIVMLGRAIRRWAACTSPLIAAACGAQADEPAVRALTTAYNASGLALYRELAGPSGNIVLSPYSIGSAMAMARSGARGETERQMASVLKHTLPREAADLANGALLAILKGYDHTGRPGSCPPGTRWASNQCEGPPSAVGKCPPLLQSQGGACVGQPLGSSAVLVAANALALPKGGRRVSEAYRATVRDKYTATVHEDVGVEEINAWVREKTAGKIERLLDSLPPNKGPVLVNAVYLKAAWASAFIEVATRDDEFQLSATQRMRVPTMHQQADFRLLERAGYRALRLDYAERSLAMVVVLPNPVDGLAQVAGRLDAGELAALLGELKAAPAKLVALALPRFKARFTADLLPAFRKAGMQLAFGDAADFSGITGAVPQAGGLKIEAIRHQALIEVNEAGTEAAAATSVLMAPTSAIIERRKPIPFVVDRPFLFFVVDFVSGAVLFQGRISDPRN